MRSVQSPSFVLPRVEGGHSCPPPSFGGLENPPSHKEERGGGLIGLNGLNYLNLL